MEPKIEWLGHASFRIDTGSKIIYIDPWKTTGGPKGDLILITHSHPDHLSQEDISRLKKDDTVIIGSMDVVDKMPGVIGISAGMTRDVENITIEAHKAYNLNKEFHPQNNGWLGFVIDIDGYRIYHSGDTDVIPEMNDITNIDVALLPVGGTYTMTPEEAASAVKIINPKKAIPMHWGDIIGGEEDARKFDELASCDVKVLKKT